MKEVTLEVLKDASSRLMFDMSEDEYATLLNEFGVIIEQMKKIGEIKDLDNEESMFFPFDCSVTELREDIPDEALERDLALKNAGSKLDGQIKLPKVVG